MPRTYSLSAAQRQACRLLSYAFAAASLIQFVSIGVALTAPAFIASQIVCTGSGCTFTGAPLSLLPDSLRLTIGKMANAVTTLENHFAAPAVRLKLLVAETMMSLPVMCLLLTVAIAVYALSRGRNDDLARALPWLRRAAVLALISVLLVPLGESMRTTVVMQAFRPATRFHLSMEIERVALHLLLALVALAVTWPLAAGIKAEQDLAEIV